MESVNTNSIAKKSLKVSIAKSSVNESINQESPKEIQEPIEAPKKSKKIMMTLEEENPVITKPEKIDGRGKSDKVKENLAKGRAKLVELWAEKKKIKEDLMNAALEKKVQQRLKQEQKINEAFGIDNDDSDESDGLDENGYTPKQAEQIKQKELKKQQILQQKQQKQAPPVIKKEKKKVIKYVEVESESEEEEIVYVKKQKSQKSYTPVVKQQTIVQQPEAQQQLLPRIQFF